MAIPPFSVPNLSAHIKNPGADRGSTARRGRHAADPGPAPGKKLNRFYFVILIRCAIAVLEFGDASASVKNLLLARVEGVAHGAHICMDHTVLSGAAGVEGASARARYRRLHVIGMDIGFHFILLG